MACEAKELLRRFVVFFTKLVAKREPSGSQVIVPSKQLYLVSRWHEQVDDGVDLLRLLTLLSDFGDDQIVGYFRIKLDILITRALVSNKAALRGVQEVEAVRDVYLAIFLLDPSELVNDLVAPLVHALVTDVHLRIEDPKEAKTFI